MENEMINDIKKGITGIQTCVVESQATVACTMYVTHYDEKTTRDYAPYALSLVVNKLDEALEIISKIESILDPI